jgi:hypothetical protein
VEPYDFDTPPVEDVLQAETGAPDDAIPVFLTNPVNVNQLPTTVGGLFSRELAASPAVAVKVLNEDPRRAAVTVSCSGIEIAIGRSQAEADDVSAFRVSTNQGPYKFHFTDELWVRSTAAATRASFCVEQWAR